jgi:hypothetical protein
MSNLMEIMMTKDTSVTDDDNVNAGVDSIYALFQTDKTAEQEGIILNYGRFGKIRVARAGGSNKKFAKALEMGMRPHRSAGKAGLTGLEGLDDAVAEDILVRAFAESVVLGWEGVKGLDGKLIPFSKDNVIKLFKDMPDLFADVRDQSAQLAAFRAHLTEVDSGN